MRSLTMTFMLSLSLTLPVIWLDASGSPRVPEARGPELDTFVTSLAGGWSGETNMTPLGPMPFAIVFEWDEGGDLHGHSALNSETYIDLRFTRDSDGRWMLREEAAMEGLGSHMYSLVPADGPGQVRRWQHAENPDFLIVDFGLETNGETETMLMEVRLRGENHVRFELERLSEASLQGLREQLARQALQTPSEGIPIHELARASETEDVPDPIRDARRAVAEEPSDARLRLRLAQALGEAIQADPMAGGPRHAGELLQTLLKAIELDPELAAAYHGLAGYYLNAPPIAGGSLEKAREVASRLVKIDPDGGQKLLTRIEERKRSQGRSE